MGICSMLVVRREGGCLSVGGLSWIWRAKEVELVVGVGWILGGIGVIRGV